MTYFQGTGMQGKQTVEQLVYPQRLSLPVPNFAVLLSGSTEVW